MCTIQENNNINMVIELTPNVVEKSGAGHLLTIATLDAFDLNKHLNRLPLDVQQLNADTIEKIADLEVCLDMLKHQFNIGYQVTEAKNKSLKALETLIK